MATEHLISLGRRRIGFLGDASLPEIGQRHAGYLAACRRAGMTPDPRLDAPAQFAPDTAEQAACRMIAENPDIDAIFAASDVIALAALNAVKRAGRRTPQDVAVVGFDDTAIAAHTSPPLTTVRQDLGLAAKLMVYQLFHRLEGEPADSITLRPELVVRPSTVAASAEMQRQAV